jgi:hypothetical protein
VAYLINEAGCDVKEVDGEGDNILDCVAAFGANQVLDYLFERFKYCWKVVIMKVGLLKKRREKRTRRRPYY